MNHSSDRFQPARPTPENVRSPTSPSSANVPFLKCPNCRLSPAPHHRTRIHPIRNRRPSSPAPVSPRQSHQPDHIVAVPALQLLPHRPQRIVPQVPEGSLDLLSAPSRRQQVSPLHTHTLLHQPLQVSQDGPRRQAASLRHLLQRRPLRDEAAPSPGMTDSPPVDPWAPARPEQAHVAWSLAASGHPCSRA